METRVSSSVRLVRRGEGEQHAVMGDNMHFLMTAEHTDGRYAISEIHVRPGSGAPPHIHHNEEEAFYVLEGQFHMLVDGVEQVLNEGDYAHVQRGAVRAYANRTSAPGRLLILHSPGSAAAFYIGMGKLSTPPPMDAVVALGKQHSIEIVPEVDWPLGG